MQLKKARVRKSVPLQESGIAINISSLLRCTLITHSLNQNLSLVKWRYLSIFIPADTNVISVASSCLMKHRIGVTTESSFPMPSHHNHSSLCPMFAWCLPRVGAHEREIWERANEWDFTEAGILCG